MIRKTVYSIESSGHLDFLCNCTFIYKSNAYLYILFKQVLEVLGKKSSRSEVMIFPPNVHILDALCAAAAAATAPDPA